MAQWSHGIAALLAVTVIGSDLYARRVPNKALLMALCLGAVVLLVQALQGRPASGSALAGLALGLATLLPFHLLGWMGAGDVKFFATLGFLLGPASLLPIWLISMCLLACWHLASVLCQRLAVGGVTTLAIHLPGSSGQQLLRLNQRVHDRLQAAQQGRQGMPYAAHLGLGALAWMAWRATA